MIGSLARLLCCVALWSAASVPAAALDSWQVAGIPRVTAIEMKFMNGLVQLSGTAYLPETGDHLPAVVALHGASNATRNSGIFRHLREGLPAMGIAVLIYDRRGSGASSGSLRDVDYETLADDAIAGQRALASLPRIDPTKIGFWGLSQGGWLAVLAAGRSENAAFAVSVSAPLATPEQQMEFATANLLTVRGYSQDDVKHMLDARKAWIDYLRGMGTRAAAVDALTKAEARPWFELAFMPKSSTLTIDPEHNAWRKQMDLDLIAAVRRARVPLLFVYGGADPWVPVSASVEQLRLLTEQRHDIRYAVIPQASHEMAFPARETMAFDTQTLDESAPQASEYFMLLAFWLCRKVERDCGPR